MISFFDKSNQPSQAERELRPLLLDEGCQVLSTFELNKIASLTFGDLVCDDIFELVEKIVSQPLDYSPLTLQKTLIVMKHVLVYGSEKCVNSAYGIGKFIENLQNFNTALAAQQQQGARGMWQRLQGGGVDRGGPVREAATEVHKLLSNIHELQRIRLTSASKESLVPIGDDKAAFVSDEVRHYLLKKRIEQQQQIEIKSNLAKSAGGFGGGYNATDGKNVVGAAHGIEEMIKMAKLEKKKWSDDGTGSRQQNEEMKILQELKAQADAEKAEAKRLADEEAAARNADLLASFTPSQPAQSMDLLDFGGGGIVQPAATSTAATTDFFGAAPVPAPSTATNDLLGLGMTSISQTPASTTATTTTDIFGLASAPAPTPALGGGSSAPIDPFAPVAAPAQPLEQPSLLTPTAPSPVAPAQQPPQPTLGDTTLLGGMTSLSMGAEPKKSIMASNQDRFAALDALASTTSTASKVTELDRKNAENRILGLTGNGLSAAPSTGLGGSNFSLGITGGPAGAPAPEPTSMPPPPPGDSPAAIGMPPPPSNNNNSLLSMPMGMPPPPPEPVVVNPSSVRVGQTYGDDDGDDEDNPWVMGGVSGSGLEPAAPAPGAPPPPPPPPS